MTRRVLALARFLLALSLAVLAAAACSDDDGDAVAGGSTTSSPAPRSTTSTTVDRAQPLEDVEAAYIASSRAFIEAAAIPDPELPALAATHTGPMLEQRRGVLLGLRTDGRVIRYPPNSQYRIEVDRESMEIDGDIARFEICGVDDGQRVIAATGEVIAGGVVSVRARIAMQRVDGVWKLAERQQIAEWEGVGGCAAE